MNFHNKKTKKIISIIVMCVIVAMVATALLPAFM